MFYLSASVLFYLLNYISGEEEETNNDYPTLSHKPFYLGNKASLGIDIFPLNASRQASAWITVSTTRDLMQNAKECTSVEVLTMLDVPHLTVIFNKIQ